MASRLTLLTGLSALFLASPAFAEGDFTLENKTGYTITAVYAGPSAENNWGPNILVEPIPHRQTLEVTLDTTTYGCMWDVRYEFADGDVFEEFEVDICRIDGENYTLE